MSGKEKYKLTKEQIEAIQADTTTSHSELGRKYKVHHSTVWYHRKMVGVKLKIVEIVKIVKCDFCGKDIEKRPSIIRETNFCSRKHRGKFERGKKKKPYNLVFKSQTSMNTKQEKDYVYYEELEKNRNIKRDEVGNIIK